MNDEQRALIYELTREDAIRLIQARDISTWKCICKNIQELAKTGALLPINVFQFYTAVRWDFNSRRYVAREIQPGQITAR